MLEATTPPEAFFFFFFLICYLIELSCGSYKRDVISSVLLGICAEGTMSISDVCMTLLLRQKVLVLVEFKEKKN